jgi:hypothetical protein
LTERLKAEASAEVFNLFNRQNVNAIDTVYGAPAFLGPIPQKSGDGVSSPAQSDIWYTQFCGAGATNPAGHAIEFLVQC